MPHTFRSIPRILSYPNHSMDHELWYLYLNDNCQTSQQPLCLTISIFVFYLRCRECYSNPYRIWSRIYRNPLCISVEHGALLETKLNDWLALNKSLKNVQNKFKLPRTRHYAFAVCSKLLNLDHYLHANHLKEVSSDIRNLSGVKNLFFSYKNLKNIFFFNF